MRKISTLLACAVLSSGSLFAQGTITINGAEQTDLKTAINNVADGGTINISGTITIDTQRTCESTAKSYSIVGSDNPATIEFSNRGKEAIMLNANGSYTVTFANITLDGGGRVWDSTAAIAGEKGSLVLDNVKVKDFTVTPKTETTDASKHCIINEKSGGNVTLNNVTFENCGVAEGYGLVCTDRSMGLLVKGNNPGLSIYLKGDHAFKVENLENATPIDVYLDPTRNASTIIIGCNDPSKFNFIGKADGYGIEVEGENIVYAKHTIVAKYNNTSYETLEAAITAAQGNVPDGDPAKVITLVDNVVLSARQIPTVGSNIIIEASEPKTITRGSIVKGNTMFEAKGESGADKPKTHLTFKNINFENTNTDVTNAMISVQYGTLTLENVNATYPNKSSNGVIQSKSAGYLVLKNVNVGEVLVNEKGNLSMSGNNAITLKLEANANVEVTEALTNETPIAITFTDGAIANCVGKVLISGTNLDAAKFSVPNGYMLEAGADGLTLREEVGTGMEDVINEDADAPVEYYNLQGIRVANPENGIFIRRQGNKVSKVAL